VHLRGIPPVLNTDVRATFDVLYDDLGGEVTGHVHRLMKGRTLDALSAEDCIQTVWTKVWANLPTVERRPGHGRHDGLRAWVHMITRNTVLDLANRASYRRHVSLAPDGMLDHGTVNGSGDAVRTDPHFEASPATDPHARAVGNEVASIVNEALGMMTEYQARCVRTMLAGLNSVESAQRQGKTGRGVRHALLRGRRTFEAVASQRGYDSCH
jgi:DNA-directed RNA polymerase specialized sigma24 family protein